MRGMNIYAVTDDCNFTRYLIANDIPSALKARELPPGLQIASVRFVGTVYAVASEEQAQ